MATRTAPVDVVAVGASAGGLVALERLLGALPVDFPAPVLVVQHVHPRHPSLLTDILARHTDLPVQVAEDGLRLRAGTVVVAIPDHHLVVRPDGSCGLTHSAPVRFVRPSVDVLFESIAQVHGPRSAGVVLTGSGRDGAMGAAAIHRAGGVVIAQDPVSAEFRSMPEATIAAGAADLVLDLTDIPAALCDLAGTSETT